MDSFYVYVYRDSVGNPFYVGKGRGRRSREHLHACHNSKWRSYKTMFYRKLRKMDHLDEKPVIEKIKDNLTEENAFYWEKHYIALWGRRDIKTGCLCNHSEGGEGSTGRQHSEESRQKMREAWQRPGHREHMVEINLGREVSVETLVKRSEALCNPSKETRQKLSKANGIPIVALDAQTGEDLMKFKSTADAGRFFGITKGPINAVLRRRTLVSAGCRWRYANESYQWMDESIVNQLEIYQRMNKLSTKTRPRKIPVIAMDIKTGEDLMKFDSACDAGRFFGVTGDAINKVLRGRGHISAGCRWRYM